MLDFGSCFMNFSKFLHCFSKKYYYKALHYIRLEIAKVWITDARCVFWLIELVNQLNLMKVFCCVFFQGKQIN